MVGLFATLIGLPKWVRYAGLAIAAALLLWGAWAYLDAREEADDKANQETGAAIQREADLAKTLERTNDANQARDDLRRDVDGARYAQCLRTARTPANCERFMRDGKTPDR